MSTVKPCQALVVGASGLVGSLVLNLLLVDKRYSTVHVLVRKTLGIRDPRLTEHIVDFEALESFVFPRIDAVFCCLGTTIKVAGSQQAFRRVDHDYVLACAQGAKRAGASHFLMVSAMGANSRSRVFYNRVKGEVESAVSQLGLRSVTIMRPSLLTGERREHRPGEGIATALLMPLSPLIPAKYRPVPAVTVARVMLDAAERGASGVQIIESDQITRHALGAEGRPSAESKS